MATRTAELTLTLCLLLLLLGKGCGEFPEVGDQVLAAGLAGHRVTLPCSFIIPDNWRDGELTILWFRNLTDKLLECQVNGDQTPECQKSPEAFRMEIPWKFLGNADLDIDGLRESDAGLYQCWLILREAYQRKSTLLRVYDDAGPEREAPPPLQGLVGLSAREVFSARNVLLIGGWLLCMILSGVLLCQRRPRLRKRIYTIL